MDVLPPWPTGLIDVWRATNGVRFTARPILPQDRDAFAAMFARLSRTTSYNRFHGSVALPAYLLDAMTQVDQCQQLALVITTAHAGNEVIVADARYVLDESGAAAEFAIVVEDRWQRMGLAMRAMQMLLVAARENGVPVLYGSVLRSNAGMLAFMQRCGFTCATDPSDRCLIRASARPADALACLAADDDFATGFDADTLVDGVSAS